MRHTRRASVLRIAVWVTGAWGLTMTEAVAAQTAPIPGFAELIRVGMEEDAIPGVAVVLVDSGRVVWRRGFGFADLSSGRRVDPDSTLFRIGSVTKVLTALGVLRLLDRREIALETPVREVVGVPALSARADDPVQVIHLLSHTGGFDQTGLGRRAPSAQQRPSLEAFLTEHLVPIRPAGTVATYDTYGMSLAGLVLESTSGVSYADFMRKEVFEPPGMRHTFIEAPDEYRGQLAVGYGLEGRTHVAQPYEWYTTLPASSADATARDIGRLMVALLGDGSTQDGRLLQPETARALREGAFRGESPPFWHGWWVGRAHGHPVLYHGGVMRGFSAQLVLLPDRRAGLFVAYNRDPETGPPPELRDRLTEAFLDHMFRGEQNEATVTYTDTPTEAFEGWWVGTAGCFTCREGEGWPLRVERIESLGPAVVGFRGARWRSVDSVTFKHEASGAWLRFSRGGTSQFRYANAGQDGLERLDGDLLARVAEWMGPGHAPEALQARLAQVVSDEERQRDMAALAAVPPTVDPIGTILFTPVGSDRSEPMRVELSRTGGTIEGWFQSRPDRPRRPIRHVVVGGNEVWLVVEVPGGVLDLRLVIEESSVSGRLREELEEVPVSGRYVPPGP